MSNMLVKQLNARVRNLFSLGTFQKRYADDKLQIKTVSGRTLEKKEAFPYGFYAKAKNGKAFIFCQGGNFDGFEIMPLVADDVVLPELEENDVAIYTDNNGNIKIVASENGKVFLGNNQENICELICGLIDEIKAIVTFGSPASQTINPATQTKLDIYKKKVKILFAEKC